MGKATKEERKKKQIKLKTRHRSQQKKAKANLELLAKDAAMQLEDVERNDLNDNNNMHGDSEGESMNVAGGALGQGESRGAIMQRHKKEWKEVRQQIQRLKDERFRLPSKRTLDGKAAKKEKSSSIKNLQSEMEQRHKKELEDWDIAHGVEVGEKVPDIVQQIASSFMDTKEY